MPDNNNPPKQKSLPELFDEIERIVLFVRFGKKSRYRATFRPFHRARVKKRWLKDIVRTFLRKDNTWLRTHADASATLEREILEILSEQDF